MQEQSKNIVNEVKNRLNIEDIVSEYITLKQSGTNHFGLCPFHDEKSPSFSVNSGMQIFKCFGCGISGDIFTFVEKIENISFKEALEKLAKKAGVEIVYSKKDGNKLKKKDRIIYINTLTQKYLAYILEKYPTYEQIDKYILKRGLNKETIKTFGLGYNPFKGNILIKFLMKRGITKQEILDYSLGVIRNGQLVDKYRGRLVIPIYSVSGDILGFSGRTIFNDKKYPKYINSSENDVFHKREILFGLFQSKEYIKKQNKVILLEGQLDVITSYQNGLFNVCATQGIGFSDFQINILKRFTNNIVLLPDMDNAGRLSLERNYIQLARNSSLDISTICLDKGIKDIDEYFSKGRSINDIHEVDVIYMFLDKWINESNDMSSIDEKIRILNRISSLIYFVGDNIKREEYIKKTAQILDLDISLVKSYIRRITDHEKNKIVEVLKKKIEDKQRNIEEYLFSLLLTHYNTLKNEISKLDINTIKNGNIRNVILKLKENSDKELRDIINSLDNSEQEMCIIYLDIHTESLDPVKDFNFFVHELKNKYINEELKEKRNKLIFLEQNDDTDESESILKEIQELIKIDTPKI